jgi:hypothetical protein
MTIGAVVNRLFREYLEPIDEVISQAPLTATITDSDNTMTHDDVLAPEEQSRLSVGVVVEIGLEQIMVLGYTPSTRTMSPLARGYGGTIPAAHTLGDPVRISPTYTRQAALDAISDTVDGLWPDLWTVSQDEAIYFGSNIWILPDANAVEILSAWTTGSSGWQSVTAQIQPAMPIYSDGVPIYAEAQQGQRLMVTYRKRLTRPTAEDDALATLGIDTGWTQILLLGAAASLLAGRELERETTEYLTQILEASEPGAELGKRSSVATNLLRVQAVHLDRAKRQLRTQYPPYVVMNKVI